VLIDAHQHAWRIGENDCAWPTPDLAAIHRDYALEDLKAVGASVGLTGSVLIQSQPSDRDTDWLLDLAAAEPLVLAVVGWTDLAARDSPARIAALAARPKLLGLRPMLQDLEDDAWILRPTLTPAIEAMIDHGMRFDALVLPRHLPHLLTFVRRWPNLPIVIDHGGKPDIASETLDPWRTDIAALAAQPNVFCKLSGLLTQAAPGQSPTALTPYAAHLVQAFGPARLMWGSDWPVLDLAGDYAAWRHLAQDLSGLSRQDDLTLLFGETARRFYRL